MFDSGIGARELIATLEAELDAVPVISKENYVAWLNQTEQLLYSEYIQEQAVLASEFEEDGVILTSLEVPEGQDNIRFEDIYTIFCLGSGEVRQMIRSSVTSGQFISDSYWKEENRLKINPAKPSTELRIIYHTRPRPKTVKDGEVSDENIALPVEFMPIIEARLRGEAYKVANEDGIAAKWLQDYNILLENFAVWLQNRSSNAGM